MLNCGRKSAVFLSRCTYQRQHEIEQSRPAVEEDGQQRRDSGEKQAHIPAHNNPQRLQDLREEKLNLRIILRKEVSTGI